MTRVLYVVHHHPSVMAGGAETYALELYEQVRDAAPGWDPLLLAGTGPTGSGSGSPHPGTLVEPVGGDPGQYLFHTDAADYDWFLSTARNKEFYTRYLTDFLRAYRPDVVHVQHSLFFGFDLLRTVRNVLPDAAIVYTLHEYLPMCFRDGQLQTAAGTLCDGPTPRGLRDLLPGDRAAGVLPARALHHVPPGGGRRLRLPERVPAREVRPVGDPPREAGARAERPPAGDAPGRQAGR